MAPWSARSLLVLLGATLIPRLLLAVSLGVVGEPDRFEYDFIAANIASGGGHVYERDGFVYAAYSPPLWSYTLAALLRFAGSTGASVQLLQALFCFGSAVVFGALARRISGEDRVGSWVGLLVALQPSLLYYSVVKSDPLPLNVFLLGLISVSASNLAKKPGERRAVIFGGLVGLGLLSRGTPIVALPLVLLALLLQWRRKGLKPFAVAALAFTLCVAPWLARNWVRLGTPLITSTTGENFWRGNHEGASGGVSDLNGGLITWLSPANPALPDGVRRVMANGTEADRHEVFMYEARRFIGAHPGEAMALFARKMRTFWWRIDSDPRDYPAAASIAYEILYRVELALALFGALSLFSRQANGPGAPDRVAAGLAVGLMFSIGILQCAFYVQGRHRFMIEPLLLIFTAIGFTDFSNRLARRDHRE